MTVLEAIRRSSEFLEKKGVESPRLNAELLLAHALGVERMKLYLAFDRVLEGRETAVLRELIVRRGRREPIQQIVGSTSFCGHEIEMSRHVLTPRPETELLAETGVEILSAGPDSSTRKWNILDIGTGSGCLAVTLALRFQGATVTAVDTSAEALAVAGANVSRHGLDARVKLVHSDLFEALPPEPVFDLIISNPPYIPTPEIPALQPEVRDFEPLQALDGGKDGLDFYRRLASEGSGRLNQGAALVVEFGDGQAPALVEIFSNQNWVVEPPREDYTRRLRILVARRSARSSS